MLGGMLPFEKVYQSARSIVALQPYYVSADAVYIKLRDLKRRSVSFYSYCSLTS